MEMNLLRGQVKTLGGWWEMRLVDLEIVADGDSENAMLRDLEHALVVEYHLAIKNNQTPFVKLYRGAPPEVVASWEDGGKKFRTLNLPPEVSMALSAVFRNPSLAPFSPISVKNCAA